MVEIATTDILVIGSIPTLQVQKGPAAQAETSGAGRAKVVNTLQQDR